MSSRLRIIVTGLIAQHPGLGGVTWDYLQYPLGLAQLGHDTYYFEDSGEWPYATPGRRPGREWIVRDADRNIAHLASVMKRFDLGDRWAYRDPIRRRWFGLSPRRRREVIDSADLVINVSGTLARPWELRNRAKLVYVDSDPVFTQVKLGLPQGQRRFRKRLEAHDVWFSFGERLAKTPFGAGRRWRPTRQPIVRSEWETATIPRPVYSSVMSWTSYKPLRARGQTFGQKDRENEPVS
jgi:hypothetical protein